MDGFSIQVIISASASLLTVWGALVSYLFYTMVTCQKFNRCPVAGQCRKPTDILQSRILIGSTASLFTISIMGTLFSFPLTIFIVICSFYATYLVYSSIDVYFWRQSTKQCFVRHQLSSVRWLQK